ncbi:MAG: hypothetical protein ACI88Z_001959, partial [Sphingobacteriales bacterium]
LGVTAFALSANIGKNEELAIYGDNLIKFFKDV